MIVALEESIIGVSIVIRIICAADETLLMSFRDCIFSLLLDCVPVCGEVEKAIRSLSLLFFLHLGVHREM